MNRALAAVAAAYAAGLVWLGRPVAVDYHDGLSALLNGLLLFHVAPVSAHFDPQRPPLGWLAVSAPVAFAYARGGAWAALKVSHALMPLWLVALVALTYTLAARVASRPAAAAAAALLALNPLTLQYAPFGLLDIASGAMAAVFAHRALSWARAPSRRNTLLLCLAGLGATLAKYPLACLMLGPLAVACAPGRPWSQRARAAAPLVLALPALALAAVAANWVLAAVVDPLSWRRLLSFSAERLWTDLSMNAWQRQGPSRWLYLSSLWSQLGRFGAAAALAGLALWLRRDDDGRVLAATFVAGLAVLTALNWKEQRYAIPLLPLAYAALARGLDFGASLLPAARPGLSAATVVLAVAAFAPWRQTVATARALREEPAYTTRLPWELGRALDASAPCVAVSGDAAWRPAAPLLAYEQIPGFNATTLAFYAPRGARLQPGAASCPLTVLLQREDSGPVARLYAEAPGERKPLAQLSVAGGGR